MEGNIFAVAGRAWRELRAFKARLNENPTYARRRKIVNRGAFAAVLLLGLLAWSGWAGRIIGLLVLLILGKWFANKIAERGTRPGAGKQAADGPAATGPHDLARVYHPAHTALPQRGWRVGMPIAIGRELGINLGRAWFPHALILGATGSGKTTFLRSFIARWTSAGPAAVLSTKGDVIPEALTATPAAIHLITPEGRECLDADGEARLASLEAAGWKVLDCRWDPILWIASASSANKVQARSTVLARCLSDVVGQGEASQSFWTEASSGLIADATIIEAATIKAGASSWHDLLDPQPLAGSDLLLTQAGSNGGPGAERLFGELQLRNLTNLAQQVATVPLSLSPIERAAAGQILETATLLQANNVTALSRYQTAAIALGAYKYPDESGRQAFDPGAWAASEHDLLAVIVPSSASDAWRAPMAALALALWTEASTTQGDHLIILDEMASLAPVPNIHEWTAQGRSLGVHVVAVLQHEHQAKIWAGEDRTGWILNSWPLVMVAAGTPAIGLAKHLADGEGQHEVTKISTTKRRDRTVMFGAMEDDGSTTSTEMRDRIEPNHVFGEADTGAWRVIDRRVGPWAEAIQN